MRSPGWDGILETQMSKERVNEEEPVEKTEKQGRGTGEEPRDCVITQERELGFSKETKQEKD